MGVENVAGFDVGQASNISKGREKKLGQLTELPQNLAESGVGNLIDRIRGFDAPKGVVNTGIDNTV